MNSVKVAALDRGLDRPDRPSRCPGRFAKGKPLSERGRTIQNMAGVELCRLKHPPSRPLYQAANP